MWYPGKAALRAGRVYYTGSVLGSAFWDDDSIGEYSVAFGNNTRATGPSSTAMGRETKASSHYSTAMGYNTIASNTYSTAMGHYSKASGSFSTAMGSHTLASGFFSTAMGSSTIASGEYSTALGYRSNAKGEFSVAAGYDAKANHDGSVVISANLMTIYPDSVRSGGDEQMVLRADGGLYLTNIAEEAPYNTSRLINTVTGGYLSSGGTWTDASSRDYKENISNLSLEQAINAVQQLQPVTYNYKTDKEENCVGFIAEDVPGLVAVKDRKGLSPMDIVAVLTKVVQNQQSKIELLEQKIEQIQKSK